MPNSPSRAVLKREKRRCLFFRHFQRYRISQAVGVYTGDDTKNMSPALTRPPYHRKNLKQTEQNESKTTEHKPNEGVVLKHPKK